MASELEDLLHQRFEAYAKYSDKILKLIEPNVIPAVLEMLELTDQELDRLTWNSVSVIDTQLVVTGTVAYNEGDIIQDKDLKISIDAAMAALLTKRVRVSVPLELAATGSAQDILEHLQASAKKLKEEYETVYGHDPKAFEEATRVAMYGQLGMDIDDDFNYSDLSDEQKESLFISMTGTPGEKLN